MKRNLAVATTTLLLALAAPAHAESPAWVGPAVKTDTAFAAPDVKEAKLSNGIRVLLVELKDVPVVSVHVVSTVGGADAAPGVAELAARAAVDSAHFSHRFRTTESLNLIGAHLSADATPGTTTVSTRALAPHLEAALADLREVVGVRFPDGDIVNRVRVEALDRSMYAEQFSTTLAARAELYPPSHPYHFGELGTSQALKTLDASALRAFWARAFSAANVTIAAAGDVTLERLAKALETTFGDLPQGTRVPPTAPLATGVAPRKSVLILDRPGTSQTRIAIAGLGLPRNHPDHLALLLATRYLDGLLDERIRETYGSSYGVSASLDSARGTPPLWVTGAVENAGVAKAITEVLGAMESMGRGSIDASSLARSRLLAFQGQARALETSRRTAGMLAHSIAMGLPTSDLRTLPARLAAIGPEQIARMAKEHFDPARLRIVVCGDAKLLSDELARSGLGPVSVRKR